jgi:hypothetical protein
MCSRCRDEQPAIVHRHGGAGYDEELGRGKAVATRKRPN